MRQIRGAINHRSGQTAEACVAAHCLRQGWEVLAERWRGGGGEIDLIARDGDEVVFIEVKKGRSLAMAAARISERQVTRIRAAASEYLGLLPDGQNTPVRFDVALVDALGRIEILENALGP